MTDRTEPEPIGKDEIESILEHGQPADEDMPRVTLKQAADEIGIAISTLRRWYRTGEVSSELEPGPTGPRRMVLLSEVRERAARSDRIAPPPAPESKPVLASEWTALIHQVASAEQARANAERDAAIASHDLLRSREEAGRQRDEIERLRAELDQTRAVLSWRQRRRIDREQD